MEVQLMLNFKQRRIQQDQDSSSEISNQDIRQIIERSSYAKKSLASIRQQENEKKQKIKDSRKILMEIGERKWQTKHGRRFLINFDEKERKQMKHYFQALDKQNHGSIGIEELEELLISVGLAESRDEVKKLIDSVDEDGSGKIEFDQFLDMIESEVEGQNQDIVNFFKKIICKKLDKDIHHGLSFQLMISNIRRKKMMNALGFSGASEKKQGLKILRAYKSMNDKRMIRKIREEQKQKALQELKRTSTLSNVK